MKEHFVHIKPISSVLRPKNSCPNRTQAFLSQIDNKAARQLLHAYGQPGIFSFSALSNVACVFQYITTSKSIQKNDWKFVLQCRCHRWQFIKTYASSAVDVESRLDLTSKKDLQVPLVAVGPSVSTNQRRGRNPVTLTIVPTSYTRKHM